MAGDSCTRITRYLDGFMDREDRANFDLNRIGDHVSSCATCYDRFNRFFKTMELPESTYLRETLDEMALALYNLGKAVIRDRPPEGPEDVTENVVITEEGGGSIGENVEAGTEMIEDAEDYAGSSHIEGTDLNEIRSLLAGAESSRTMRIDLALQIFENVLPLGSRYTSETLNWIGVLHCQKEEFDLAEKAFLRVLAAPDGASNVRSWTHCNLGYVHKSRGDVSKAVDSARRSVKLAEVDNKDPYFGRFASVYFLALRDEDGDFARAEEMIEQVLAAGDRDRFRSDLMLASNAPVLEVLRNSGLTAKFLKLAD